MELAEYNIEKLKLEKKSMIWNFLFKISLLLCAVVYVISSETNLLSGSGIFQREYKISCSSDYCLTYNPKNGISKVTFPDRKDLHFVNLEARF